VFGSFSGSDDVSDEPSRSVDDAEEGTAADAAAAEAEEVLEEVYFAKFLTSSKLMTLQLRDGYFRRHVLVQILIFLQTVVTERKGMPTLSASQRQQVDGLHTRCFELLRAIPPGGVRFASAVATMLEREEHWIRWKANGCVPFDKAAAAIREESGGGASAAGVPRKRKAAAGGGAVKKMFLGNAALTKLWNMGGNALEDIAQKQSEVVPGLSDYLAPVAEQMDPEAGIEEEYKVKNDKAFQWKALRLMAKKDVALLSKVSAPNGGLEAAVKHYFDQQGDGPGEKVEGDAEQAN
jgi:THO complex subunit 1